MIRYLVPLPGFQSAYSNKEECHRRYLEHGRAARQSTASAEVIQAHTKARDQFMIAADTYQLATDAEHRGAFANAVEFYQQAYQIAAEGFKAASRVGRASTGVAPSRRPPTMTINRYEPPSLSGELTTGAAWRGNFKFTYDEKEWTHTGAEGLALPTGERCWEYQSIECQQLWLLASGEAWKLDQSI